MSSAPQSPNATQVLRASQAAPTRLLQYELVRKVGAGAMGAVYLARDTDLSRDVAIKLVHPTWAREEDRLQTEERFLREARSAARLNHPNVAVVYQVGRDAGVTFIAMEWIAGTDLGQVVGRGPLPWREATAAIRDAAAALVAAHAQGLVHRDVKPSNLMRLASGAVKLVDFGLARLHEAPSDLTVSGAVLGTPAYMAPELFQAQAATPASDLYSLACTYYHLLTGRVPFPGAHMVSVMQQHVGTPMPDPRAEIPDLPAAVARIVARGAAKQPQQRYKDAASMLADLQAALDGHAGAAPSTAPGQPHGDAGAGIAVAAAPATPSLPAPSTGNLPAEVGTFIGREQPIAQLSERLRQARLVTLTGPGGTGKTRLSQHVARLQASSYPDGVWLVELAALPVGGDATLAAAAVFGVRESTGQGVDVALARHLSDKHALLILDNCEHLIDSAAALAASLLARCAPLRLLATSRQALGTPGEVTLALPPMAVAADDAPVASLAGIESVRFFVERARAARSGFACEGDTTTVVAQICRRLDGIPLAIELAAARVKVLSPQQISARLDNAFGLLAAGQRTLLPRQQTLQALIDWSWQLLDDGERRALARCSVFAGEFSLEAAEAVLADPEGEGAPFGVIDALTSLVDKSLLVATERGGAMRYDMLQTIRDYAAAKLDPAQTLAARQRHARHYSDVLARAWKGIETAEHAATMAKVALEHGQARAAFEAALEQRWFDIALPLGNLLANYWNLAGVLVDGLARVSRLLALKPPPGPETAAVLRRAADLAVRCGQLDAARGWLEEGLTMARSHGDVQTAARLLNGLGALAYSQGLYEVAAQRFAEYLDECRARADVDGQIRAVNNLAIALRRLGRPDEARRHFHDALAQLQSMSNQRLVAYLNVNLGDLEEEDGRHAQARLHYQACLGILLPLDDDWGVALARAGLGKCALAEGDGATARAQLHAALVLLRTLGERATVAEALDHLARTALADGQLDEAGSLATEALQLRLEAENLPDVASSLDTWTALLAANHPDHAARLLGCAAAVRASHHAPLESARRRAEQALRDTLARRLGDDRFEQARAEGAASDPMLLAQALITTRPAGDRRPIP
ncbi:MAG: protein kinase [Rubrivivax sp.]|nr:protein kinase [Rubrivivax sp.]